MPITKGIILAGGRATRLFPMTNVVSKQLMPVYDKPMIYYPLSVLMLAGIKDILVICNPHDEPLFRELLKDGSQWGIKLSYIVQEKPEGIAQAFHLGASFIDGQGCALILGDNIFYGQGFRAILGEAVSQEKGATVFGYWVNDPEKYGVAAFDDKGQLADIIEKPEKAPSNYAITGLYFYDNQVVDIAAGLKKSARGEYEITDVNRVYLERGELRLSRLTRGFAWLDTGSPDTLLQAASFMETIASRQGLKVCAPEEVAFFMEFIDRVELKRLADELSSSDYGRYLARLADYGKGIQ